MSEVWVWMSYKRIIFWQWGKTHLNNVKCWVQNLISWSQLSTCMIWGSCSASQRKENEIVALEKQCDIKVSDIFLVPGFVRDVLSMVYTGAFNFYNKWERSYSSLHLIAESLREKLKPRVGSQAGRSHTGPSEVWFASLRALQFWFSNSLFRHMLSRTLYFKFFLQWGFWVGISRGMPALLPSPRRIV